MIIMKFGGSSLRDAERILEVCSIVKEYRHLNPIVVVSAMGKTTDSLLEDFENSKKACGPNSLVANLHRETVRDLGLPESLLSEVLAEYADFLASLKDSLVETQLLKEQAVSYGERLSARIVAAALEKTGLPSDFSDAWDIGFLGCEDSAGAEMISPQCYQEIRVAIENKIDSGKKTLVVTGFILHDRQGRVRTFGRGGSDLTATLLGAAVQAEEVQVWKDVDGVLTADPRLVADAKPLKDISYAEAAELAYFGAKVLHPICLLPVSRAGIPVRVKNSYKRGSPGTRIGNLLSENIALAEQKPRALATAVTSKHQVVLIDIQSHEMLGQYGFLAKVFEVFSRLRISVDMIATSEVSVSVTTAWTEKLPELCEGLSGFAQVSIRDDVSALSVIGAADESSEILFRAGRCLSQLGVAVDMLSVGASRLNIGMIVPRESIDDCVRALHKELFSEKG